MVLEMPKVFCTDSAMELPCVIFPIPKQAMAVKIANRIPSHFCPIPRSSAYMGPPMKEPSFARTLYLMERTASLYFVAMPKSPVSQIQSTAPGPPIPTAVATPTIFPVPMVAAMAVASAPKPLTSPLASVSGVTDILIALSVFLWMNLVRNVRNTWVPTRRQSMTGPHTKPLMVLTKLLNASITPPPLK